MLSVTHIIIVLVAVVSYSIGAHRQAKHDLDTVQKKLRPYLKNERKGRP